MMKRTIPLMLVLLAACSGSAWAADGGGKEQGRMLVDAVVARPLGLVVAAASSLAFVVTLPFSLATNSVRKSADVLVVGPAREVFVRCLGCVNAGRVGAGESAR